MGSMYMKALHTLGIFQKLETECTSHAKALYFIRDFFPDAASDIKHVRYDEAKKQLIIGVEPWVWTWFVRDKLQNNKAKLTAYFQKNIENIQVRFMHDD